MHWYLKIPRFDGRKTLAFNGLVFVVASAAHIWLVAGGSAPAWSVQTWLMLLGGVAALNGLLRLVTERPVWWRQMQWSGWDLASGESETVYFTGGDTVYHKAAEFVMTSDFTEAKDREQSKDRLHRDHVPPRIVPYADFQRELDSRLLDTREAFDGQFYGNGPHVLPLDADERAN